MRNRQQDVVNMSLILHCTLHFILSDNKLVSVHEDENTWCLFASVLVLHTARIIIICIDVLKNLLSPMKVVNMLFVVGFWELLPPSQFTCHPGGGFRECSMNLDMQFV